LIYLGALALGVVLHALVPLPWFSRPFADILVAVGVLAVGAGVLLDVLAFRTLSREKTTILPHKGSTHLVTGGPFAVTRNPIYVGNTLFLLGIGLIFGIAWLMLLAPLAAFATQKLAIEPEERHLEARFGKAFRDYRKRVRRWI
jgi:protein-S-isoprenylcysteine O-methyltransferase Ste14